MFKHSRSKHINLAKLYHSAEGIYNNIPTIKQKKKSIRIKKLLKTVLFTMVFLLIVIVGFSLYGAMELRSVYYNAATGKSNAEYSAQLLKEKDYESAKKFAQLAESNFDDALSVIDKHRKNFLIKYIGYFSVQYNEASHLLTTAKMLSTAISNTADFAYNFNELFNREVSFENLSIEEKREILRHIYQSAPELAGIKANLDLAILNLDNLKFNGILWPIKAKIIELKKQIIVVNQVVEKSIPMSQIIPAIFGYPAKSTYLVLLQNSDELRPTGGFLGTYGILQTENGDILRYDTHDIYHMDMPVKDLVNEKPPAPIAKYLGVDKWYMRDSNWSPDWPSAAEKIEWFYHKENKLLPTKDQINNFDETFSGVIAINPKFITDLLEIVGPITLDNVEYNSGNFVDLLQYKVEKGYVQLGIPSWQRKELIGDIVEELKKKLFTQSLTELIGTIQSVSNNLSEKNVMINMYDSQLQELIADQGWGGKISDTPGDYLMVVDANMAALKTDAVMNKALDYKVNQTPNGLMADLRIMYSHNGDFDWKTTRYRSYVRIYVPLHSELISAKGLSEGQIETYEELGKTVFAGFISVEPGKITSLEISYKLPKEIANLTEKKAYDLYVQKQSGNDIKTLTLSLNFAKNVESYKPTGFYVVNENGNIKWQTDLLTDKIFRVEF
jgi:hypothetical protein